MNRKTFLQSILSLVALQVLKPIRSLYSESNLFRGYEEGKTYPYFPPNLICGYRFKTYEGDNTVWYAMGELEFENNIWEPDEIEVVGTYAYLK